MKRSQPKRNWSEAIAKRDSEGGCRVCGSRVRVEFAHLSGRVYDPKRDCIGCQGVGEIEDIHTGATRTCSDCKGIGTVRYVRPESGIPLCGPVTVLGTCHGLQHSGRLDLIPYVTPEEAACAVLDLGLERAYWKLRGCWAASPRPT